MIKRINTRFGVLALMVLTAALSRLLPHPPNFAPIGAMALFGAAYFSKKHLALILPIAAMWLSDIIINNVVYAQYFDGFTLFYQGFYWTYGAFVAIGVLGFLLLKTVKVQNVAIASILAAFLFFLISNFGVWQSGTMYPKTLSGLTACYTAGLPFLKNTLLGNLFYNSVLFGAFELAQYKYNSLRINPIQIKKGQQRSPKLSAVLKDK